MKTLNFLTILILTSCNNSTVIENIDFKNKLNNNSKKTEIEKSNLIEGAWKIDSVAENDIVIDRLKNDSLNFTAYVFKPSNKVEISKKDKTGLKSQLLGTYRIERDSVYFLSEKNIVFQRYQIGFQNQNKVLILKSGIYLNSKNKKKPTFFLSKILIESSAEQMRRLSN